METTKKLKTIAAILVSILLLLLLILSLTLSHSETFFLIVGIDSAIILAILIWYLVHRFTHNPTAPTSLEGGEELRLEYSALRKAAGMPAKFRYSTIEAATDGFQSLIGRGSSGSVFKGILDDGTAVAVKRIEGSEFAKREFRAEVTAVGSIQHVSLVRLLGYCLVPGGGARFLVYEFLPNGSLDKWIFPASGRHRERPALGSSKCGCLPWRLRYQAAVDVARALSYLHHDCRSKVLHLDVKPELGHPYPSTMGRLAEGTTTATTLVAGVHKPRFLCLHGFRTSGAIMKTQVVGKWPEKVTSRLDLVFADAPFPAEGKSDVDGIFDPPYYEWFQFDKDFMTYTNFDECLAYIEELMIKLGPFDGLMGFSQGAILSAALPGLQAKGLALTRVPKIKYLMIISGAKFASPELAEKAYSSKIACPSLHFLDDKSLQVMLEYLEKIEKDLHGDAIETAEEFAENI